MHHLFAIGDGSVLYMCSYWEAQHKTTNILRIGTVDNGEGDHVIEVLHDYDVYGNVGTTMHIHTYEY